jgi:hypothetical protein
MTNARRSEGTPSLAGDVSIRKVDPGVTPMFDDGFEVVVRAVDPEDVPSLASEDPQVRSVTPADPTLHNADPIVVNVRHVEPN